MPYRNNNQKKAAAASTIIYQDDATVRDNMNGDLSGYSIDTLYHGSTGVDMGIAHNGNDVLERGLFLSAEHADGKR